MDIVDAWVPAGSAENSEKTAGRLISVVRGAGTLTQREVAARLGRSRAWVSMVEAGQRGLHLEEVPSWADALQLDAFLVERMVRGCRGLFWNEAEGTWDFYKAEITEVSRADGTFDEEGAYGEAMTELTWIVNQLADPRHDRKVVTWDDEGIVVLTPNGRGTTIPISLPLTATAIDDAPVQGTRADVEHLLARMTDQQVSLAAAFMRGLIAQARTRSPGGTS